MLKCHSSLSDENKELKSKIKHLRSEQERQKSTLNGLEQYQSKWHLFGLIRMKCEEKGWTFSWTKNGLVFARTSKQSLIAKIGNLKELDKK